MSKRKDGVDRGAKNEVVIRGYHPEMALQSQIEFDNSDPYLESKIVSRDITYVGPKPTKLEDKRPL